MGINSNNTRAYGDITQRVFTGILGSTLPTSPLAANVPTGYYDVGWLDDDAGLTEDSTLTTTQKFGWQGSSLIRTLKSQVQKSFTFNAVEENAVTMGLLRPASTQTTTGATAEVQTITISGTPAGGTFILYSQWGSSTFAFNVPTATMATVLTALVGGTVGVTGTAGTSYVVTFPTSLGNVPQMSTNGGATFTGGSSPNSSVATTTPGVNGTTTWDVKPYTGLNTRTWAIYLVDGNVHKCFAIPIGEAVSSGSPVYKGGDWTIWQFTVSAYVDANGRFYQEISDNPAIGSGLYT